MLEKYNLTAQTLTEERSKSTETRQTETHRRKRINVSRIQSMEDLVEVATIKSMMYTSTSTRVPLRQLVLHNCMVEELNNVLDSN